MTSNAADLATLLLERREALIKGWVNRVLADPEVPEANRLTPLELRDHIPAFLDELARKMDRMTSANGEQRGREANAPATEHAKERYAERYTTMAALRELSHLRAVIIDLCFRERVVLDADTAQLLHAAVDAAMARAAAEIEAASHRALREEAAVRERFMAILGHDLRTPIGSIVMAANALLRQDLTEGQASYVRRIARSAGRTGRMTADMLDLAMARLGGGLRLELKPTDTRSVCQRVIEEVQLTHPHRTVVFAPQGNGGGTFDPDRLAQAVTNLVYNALTYSDPMSEVRVGTREEGEERVVIEIHNEGAPIPEDEVDTLFDPFRRGAHGSPKTTGLGLGLFIANQIALAHGGTLDVTSTAAEGTTFRLTLPHQRGRRA